MSNRITQDQEAGEDSNLIAGEVATWLRSSERLVRELTVERRIPHVVRPGGRLVIYPRPWIHLWARDPSVPLEVVELEGDGRIVRPLAKDDQP